MLPRVVSINMLACLYQPTNLCALSEIKINKIKIKCVLYLFIFYLTRINIEIDNLIFKGVKWGFIIQVFIFTHVFDHFHSYLMMNQNCVAGNTS